MFNIYRYRLSFRKPFKTGAGTFNHRKGLILRYWNDNIDLISEAAPLPGFSVESLADVINALELKHDSINSFFEEEFTLDDLDLFMNSLPDLASLQFGISSLGLLILAKRSDSTLASVLNRSLPDNVDINAVIGEAEADELKKETKQLYKTGFKVIKCKVNGDPGHLPKTLKELSFVFPDLTFRLDANQSWKLSTIEQFSEQFTNLNVEYIEEPSKFTTQDQFGDIIDRCKIPVAADESVDQFGLSNLIIQGHSPSFFILKPMLLGNLVKLFETISQAKQIEDRIIFTTALESIVGRKIISLIAGMYGSRKTAHGLHTGILFSDDLAQENQIIDGKYHFNYRKLVLNFKTINSSKIEILFSNE